MTTAAVDSPAERFRASARQFAQRARARLGGSVHSIVLFGSVARGKPRKDSDIDLLVVTDMGEELRWPLADIASDLELENAYAMLLEIAIWKPEELRDLLDIGLGLAEDIVKEGVVLYDDGTFAASCGRSSAAGRRNARGRKVDVR